MVTILIAASGVLLLGVAAAIYSACILASRTDRLIRDAYQDQSGNKDSPNPPASGVSQRELLGST